MVSLKQSKFGSVSLPALSMALGLAGAAYGQQEEPKREVTKPAAGSVVKDRDPAREEALARGRFEYLTGLYDQTKFLHERAQEAHAELMNYKDAKVTGWNSYTGLRLDISSDYFLPAPQHKDHHAWWVNSMHDLDFHTDFVKAALNLMKEQGTFNVVSIQGQPWIVGNVKLGFDSKDLPLGMSVGFGPDGNKERHSYVKDWDASAKKSEGFYVSCPMSFPLVGDGLAGVPASEIKLEAFCMPPIEPTILRQQIFSDIGRVDKAWVDRYVSDDKTRKELSRLCDTAEMELARLNADFLRLSGLSSAASKVYGFRERAALVLAQYDKQIFLMDVSSSCGRELLLTQVAALIARRAQVSEKYIDPLHR